jgi:hypothetical protein
MLNWFCSFTQDLQITRVTEDAGSALSRDLLGYADANQVIQGNCHRGDGELKLVGDSTNAHQWFLLHVLMNTQRRRRCTSNLLNAVSILCKESQNLFRGHSGRARRDLRPIQKEGQPLFPGTVCLAKIKPPTISRRVGFSVNDDRL